MPTLASTLTCRVPQSIRQGEVVVYRLSKVVAGAVEIGHRERGDRYSEAEANESLGDNLYDAQDRDGARQAWTQALTIFDQLDHPRTEPLRAKLRVVRV